MFISDMSKQRPSQSDPAPSLSPWLGRVFHNTYTRKGRRIALRGWSVKLQHDGQRRTFALLSRSKQAAAAEARAIHDALSVEGWQEVAQRYGRCAGQPFPKTDVRYWRQRLLYRNHPELSADGSQHELSVRIDHAGAGWYFPLTFEESEGAARRALEIYSTVIKGGWEKALSMFSREVTIAFHWGQDPLLWTYVTLHTLVEADTHSGGGERKHGMGRIRVIEGDPGVRRALERCLREGDVEDPAHANQTGCRQRSAVGPTLLCLVNRDLAGKRGLAGLGRAGGSLKGVPALTYSVHPDSEELFALTPGGLSGYVLKRVKPTHIMEPAGDVLTNGRISVGMLGHEARGYFQRLLETSSASETSNLTSRLTRREHDVLELLSKGCVDKIIAQVLGISTWTVHEHVKRIFEKLKVHSRTEAVLAYFQK